MQRGDTSEQALVPQSDFKAFFFLFWIMMFCISLTVTLTGIWLMPKLWANSNYVYKGQHNGFEIFMGCLTGAVLPALILAAYRHAKIVYNYFHPFIFLLNFGFIALLMLFFPSLHKYHTEYEFTATLLVITSTALVLTVFRAISKIGRLMLVARTSLTKKQKAATAASMITVDQKPSFKVWVGTASGTFARLGHAASIAPGVDVELVLQEAAQNMIIFGGIGSGKTTRMVHPTLIQLLRQQCGGLIFDIKSDFKKAVYEFAGPQWSGRDVVTVGVKDRPLNLLKGLSPETCGTFLKSAFVLESGKIGNDAYWIENAVNMCVGALGILQHIPGRYSLEALYYYVFDAERRKEYNQLAEDNKVELAPYERNLLEGYLKRYDTHFGSLDPKTKGLIESTVSTVLINFTHPDLARSFCTDSNDAVAMQEVLNGAVYLVDLPLSIYGTGAKVVYMWIKLLLFNVMQQRAVRPDWNQDRPVFFLCDEYQEIIAASKTGLSDLNFWDKSRSSKCIGIVSMQSVSSLYAAIGNKDVADTVLQNFRQKVCFRTEDVKTIEYFNKMLGRVERTRVTESISSSNGRQGRSDSTSRSQQVYEKDMLTPQVVRTMNANQCIAVLTKNGESYDDILNVAPYFVD